MSDKLTWQDIARLYDREWVELVDYDWPDGETHPRSGIVRAHAPERKSFYQLCKQVDQSEGVIPDDAAIVFVGKPLNPSGTFLSTSLVRVTQCE